MHQKGQLGLGKGHDSNAEIKESTEKILEDMKCEEMVVQNP